MISTWEFVHIIAQMIWKSGIYCNPKKWGPSLRLLLAKKQRQDRDDPALFPYIPRKALARKTAIWALVTGFPGP
jgi:hypothetical protein